MISAHLFKGRSALVDMDGVLTNLPKGFDLVAQTRLPAEAFATRNDKEYWIENSFHPDYHEELNKILCEKDFYRNLEPIPGAIEALHEMNDAGLEVFICTAPHPDALSCMQEKVDWIDHHLGRSFVKRTIMTWDKTIVIGDFLIDDKPKIEGLNPNSHWIHIVYDQIYNQHIETPHRLHDWSDWREVLTKAIKNPS